MPDPDEADTGAARRLGHGPSDRGHPCRSTARAAASGPLTRLEGAGHFLSAERPEEVVQSVRALLAQVRFARGARR